MECPYPLRRHQREALTAVQGALAEGRRRLWVTMPPGAGKTLVGTEVACLLEQPTVVFSPNTAIQGQWAATWNAYGGPAAATERSLDAHFTSLTYQSLAVFDGENGEDSESHIDRLHPNGEALVAALRAAGPITVVLDECHHLLEVWGELLHEVLAGLPDATVLGLTATPPNAMTREQTELSAALFGPILYEARIPALVKEGTLAPYAELAWLVEPTAAENDWLSEQSTRFSELTADLFDPAFGSIPFGEWTRRRFVESDLAWDTLAAREPALADAALRLVHAGLLELPHGARVRDPHRHPLSADDWMVLVDDWLRKCVVPGGADEDVLEAVRLTLPSIGYLWTKHGVRRGRGTVDRVLARSQAKETAVATILAAEHLNLGAATRALVLCDHERATATTRRRLTGETPEAAGSATGVLGTLLADPAVAALHPLLVTGRTVAASAPTLEALRALVRTEDPRLAARLLIEADEDHARLVGPWSSATWLPWVTRFFASGGSQALVGTRGLLGEGWDAPCITTLVDLTAVTTATAVVQTRGRALRIDPADPGKVALIWTVVCASDKHVAGGNDWLRFVRKHVGYFTADASGTVVDGVAGVDPEFSSYEPPPPTDFGAVNARMLVRAEDRAAIRTAWLDTPAYADTVTHQVTLTSRPRERTSTPAAVVAHGSRLVRRDRRAGWWPALGAVPLAVGAGALNPWAGAALGIAWILGVMLRHGRGLLRDASRPTSFEQVGAALADAMHAVGLSPVGSEGLCSDVGPDGDQVVWLDGVDEPTSAAFAAAFEEVVSPMAEPRYVVPRWVTSPPRGVLPALLAALGRHRPEGEVWHTVPRLLAGKREHADAFAKAWDRWVGGGEAMYAKTPEAEGVLVTHRGEDPFAATCVIRRVWE